MNVRDYPVELNGKVDPVLYRRLEQIFTLIYELQQAQRELPTRTVQAVQGQLSQLLGSLREPLIAQDTPDPQGIQGIATVPGAITSFNGSGGGNITVTATTDSATGAVTLSVTITPTPTFTSVDVSSGYEVGGTQVVGPQGAAVPDAVGGVTIDAEARTALNDLLARLRVHGLIA